MIAELMTSHKSLQNLGTDLYKKTKSIDAVSAYLHMLPCAIAVEQLSFYVESELHVAYDKSLIQVDNHMSTTYFNALQSNMA